MQCSKCGENNIEMFHLGVCRRCKTITIKEHQNKGVISKEIAFDIQLTPAQAQISNRLLEEVEHGDVFIDAVCGAGKTEICLELVKNTIQCGKRVGWAIPRREVVLDLKTRLEHYFSNYSVVAVCQGFTSEIYGDLIVCTTH